MATIASSSPPPSDTVDAAADALLASYRDEAPSLTHIGAYELPSAVEIVRCVEIARELLFPGFVGAPPPLGVLSHHVRGRLAELFPRLQKQVHRGLHHRCRTGKEAKGDDCEKCADLAHAITTRFVESLPALRAALATDVVAAYDGDPAASGTDEIIFCYPGLYAVTCYRIAHALLRQGAQIIPRIITEHAHGLTGVDIHPGATIGRSFFIDHGTGVVIGETGVIGDRVRIYQGVTLGALSLPKGRALRVPQAQRHPTIESDVVIYANATILGGETVIGKGAVIGGNCWVTESVPPGARVVLDAERVVTVRPAKDA
jgi:serine O-acetyltransferase